MMSEEAVVPEMYLHELHASMECHCVFSGSRGGQGKSCLDWYLWQCRIYLCATFSAAGIGWLYVYDGRWMLPVGGCVSAEQQTRQRVRPRPIAAGVSGTAYAGARPHARPGRITSSKVNPGRCLELCQRTGVSVFVAVRTALCDGVACEYNAGAQLVFVGCGCAVGDGSVLCTRRSNSRRRVPALLLACHRGWLWWLWRR